MLTYFMWSVAFRHLRYSISQSLLTIGVVAISVLLIIYLWTIISGTQTRIVQNTTGSLPHITVEPPERTPLGAWNLPAPDDASGKLYVGEVVNLPRVLKAGRSCPQASWQPRRAEPRRRIAWEKCSVASATTS